MAYILVVDDDAGVRDSVATLLSVHRHEVAQAEDGKQCDAAVAERVPDLVILDIMMPIQEGIETTRLLRRRYPGLKILAMSGGGDIHMPEALGYAASFGADATLTKPFRTDDLLATVQRLLGASARQA
jgi:DNA-binding response OmpR family regulator